ncbi:putative Transmembrane protein [Melia azedarach]|uniref:Transmembrane protein n=1 Tax=Melia azedarach TaxID=155640 RepID=A0ACC1WY86_MELAZ|nr:putative Transmembrane protein [Melia azedarach]
MTRNTALLIALTCFLAVASIFMCANATAAARFQAFDHTAYPQGCRCCRFIWKPLIHCGQVCCSDGCCAST